MLEPLSSHFVATKSIAPRDSSSAKKDIASSRIALAVTAAVAIIFGTSLAAYYSYLSQIHPPESPQIPPHSTPFNFKIFEEPAKNSSWISSLAAPLLGLASFAAATALQTLFVKEEDEAVSKPQLTTPSTAPAEKPATQLPDNTTRKEEVSDAKSSGKELRTDDLRDSFSRFESFLKTHPIDKKPQPEALKSNPYVDSSKIPAQRHFSDYLDQFSSEARLQNPDAHEVPDITFEQSKSLDFWGIKLPPSNTQPHEHNEEATSGEFDATVQEEDESPQHPNHAEYSPPATTVIETRSTSPSSQISSHQSSSSETSEEDFEDEETGSFHPFTRQDSDSLLGHHGTPNTSGQICLYVVGAGENEKEYRNGETPENPRIKLENFNKTIRKLAGLKRIKIEYAAQPESAL